MDVCKVFVPCGALGAGIDETHFGQGTALNPDIISLDAGSTDSGPYYLGTGQAKYAKEAIKSDLRLILIAAAKLRIPVTIGSCGTCGTNNMVDWMDALCREIFAEEKISLRIARIYSEQTPEAMARAYESGGITPLEAAPAVDAGTFTQCSHIVALAGIEPFIEALRQGAQVVLCGRATDTANIACFPVWKGFDSALAWHGAKIAECGALCTDIPTDGGVLLTFDTQGLLVSATAAGNTCSVRSVAAHLLYENSNPIQLTEPGCVIDTAQTAYEQVGESVRVRGTKLLSTPYTMKLEGSGIAGYQTFSLVGIRDPQITQNPMPWLATLETYVRNKLAKFGIAKEQYTVELRPYGWNAVSGGKAPEGYAANELGLLFIATAKTQTLATKVAKVFNPYLLHFPTKLSTPLPSYAFPFSPAETERGAVYQFMLNHVLQLNDPLAAVEISLDQEGI